jgi:hypothetical protein
MAWLDIDVPVLYVCVLLQAVWSSSWIPHMYNRQAQPAGCKFKRL